MLAGCGIWFLGVVVGLTLYILLVQGQPTLFQAKNFLGKSIPSSAGFSLLICCIISFTGLFLLKPMHRPLLFQISFAIAMTFGGLGLADDIFGDRAVGGLRGHFTQLVREGRLTTGASKAIGGSIVALAIGFTLHPSHPITAFIGAGVIALTANAINLTDTRPGRALFVGTAVMIVGLLIGCRELDLSAGLIFIPLLILSLALFLFDRRAALMIGDSGANLLGALAGLLWVVLCPPIAQGLFLLVLLWFHWWTESHSLTQTISNTRWLNKLDRLIGVRR